MKWIAAFVAAGLFAPVALAQDASRIRPIVRDTVLKRAGAQFDKMDANKDGVLDAAEQAAFIDAEVAKVRARLTARFAEADGNKDGKISREKFVGARGNWFDSVVSNGDGTIDQTELRAYTAERSRYAREGAKP